MRKYTTPSAVIVVILAGLALVAGPQASVSGQEWGSAPEAQEGILLLRNGQTLTGKIARSGDRYYVAINGGEISVRSSEVEMACRSLDEAYQQKRSRIQQDNIRDHLELAQWCQQQGLLGAAAQELADAMAIDPTHPMIPLVDRRLKLAVLGPQKADRPANPADRPPTNEELDRLVRGMPPGTVETFTQTIQPMLMNNCTASGCHGPGPQQGFSLLRAPTGRPPSRRLTQRNLLATIQLINRSDPASSLLLSAPTRPHGTAKAPIFTDHQLTQYQQLVDWVYSVAQMSSPVSPGKHREPARRPSRVFPAGHTAPLSPEERTFPPSTLNPLVPRVSPSPGAAGLTPGASERNPAGRPAPKSPLNRAQPIPTSPPADSLDPEVFNRQFAPPSPRPVPQEAPPEEPPQE